MPTIGDTVRLWGEFKDWDGNYADPTSVTVKVYDQNHQVIETATATRDDVGKYYYDYIISSNNVMPVTFEYSGMLGGNPILGRSAFSPKWV